MSVLQSTVSSDEVILYFNLQICLTTAIHRVILTSYSEVIPVTMTIVKPINVGGSRFIATRAYPLVTWRSMLLMLR